MIPQKILVYLYIFFTLLVFSSCQKKGIFIPKETKSKTEVRKLIATADHFNTAKQFDSAFYYYNKAKINCNPGNNTDDYIYCIWNMADIQHNQDDFIGSENTVKEALPFLSSSKNAIYKWNVHTISGNNYINLYNYDCALYSFKKALRLKTDETRKLKAKNNIASVFIKERKYNEALEILLSLSLNRTLQQNPEYYSKILDKIGFCYFKLENKMALSFYTKSLAIKSKLKNDSELGKTYYYLAEYYQKSNPVLSLKYANLSYKKYTITNCIDNRLKTLALLIKNSSDTRLKRNSILYVALTDSVFEIKQKAKNLFARIKYDSKKEKEENLKLKSQKIKNELQLARQETRNIISYVIILVALVFIIILYFYLKSRANREKIKATYHSETRISKKLHDELANDVYHAMVFAENTDLSTPGNKKQLLDNLNTIYSRSGDISKEKCPINTDKDYLISLKQMISGFHTPKSKLLLNGLDAIRWNEIEKIQKINIYRTVQELLVNMKKHSKATLVILTFKENNNNISIDYTDNGQGIDLKKIVVKNGLYNVENRISAAKGSIAIESNPEKGFKVFIKFPLV
ncbi:ATP-binding protein [Flavobacterium sp. ENC]|uniref:tetratricopeptide repeat-containing sensor histidine kinase n=1 Tax=Flavobacterium sp. ENC TaxID=2897330 RepID=UPI001E34B080|nr:ATP-binding protein [Flavobacterium sp. ENC]MCD0466536.1 ATP-binding protein [Flavobacterium sp. ENC]